MRLPDEWQKLPPPTDRQVQTAREAFEPLTYEQQYALVAVLVQAIKDQLAAI